MKRIFVGIFFVVLALGHTPYIAQAREGDPFSKTWEFESKTFADFLVVTQIFMGSDYLAERLYEMYDVEMIESELGVQVTEEYTIRSLTECKGMTYRVFATTFYTLICLSDDTLIVSEGTERDVVSAAAKDMLELERPQTPKGYSLVKREIEWE